MSNVYNIFTKKKLVAVHDYEANERMIEEDGRYIGKLTQLTGDAVREVIELLLQKQQQVDNLLDEYHAMYNNYAEVMARVLAYLNVPVGDFNPSAHHIFVDEQGHTWLVDIKEEDDELSYLR